MGAKMYGNRSGRADNDNVKPKDGKPGEVPIKPEDRRLAPVVEKRPGKGWYCLVTVPQSEYRCADGLTAKGVVNYVPTNTHWERRRKGRDLLNTEVQTPLFRGYVFAQLSQPEWRDGPLGSYATLKPDWGPVFDRDAWGQSRLGVLHFLGNHGVPVPMPLRIRLPDGKLGGLAPLADEEREGWFDERKRPVLVAYREKCKAEIRAMRAMKPVMTGESVSIISGPFAGLTAQALNDNDDKGRFKIMREIMGAMRLVEVSLSDVENLDRPMRPENVALRRA